MDVLVSKVCECAYGSNWPASDDAKLEYLRERVDSADIAKAQLILSGVDQTFTADVSFDEAADFVSTHMFTDWQQDKSKWLVDCERGEEYMGKLIASSPFFDLWDIVQLTCIGTRGGNSQIWWHVRFPSSKCHDRFDLS